MRVGLLGIYLQGTLQCEKGVPPTIFFGKDEVSYPSPAFEAQKCENIVALAKN